MREIRDRWRPAPAALFTLLASIAQFGACAGGSEPAGSAQLPTSPTSEQQTYRFPLVATVRIGPDGPQPASVTVNVGGRVSFINDDVRPHEIVSDPYLRHEECPPINRVGLLAPGQQRESAVFENARSCGFHDHLDHTGIAGRIEVRIE